jgi:shikimate kinase
MPPLSAVERRYTVAGERMTLKLKRTPGLYLVGFMACGKTTIGYSLAEELGWSFVDIDREIETREGKTITQIFVERGETVFRELETEMIRARVSQVESGNPCVVALGGGAFVQPRNWDLIGNNGITVWLDCPFETILKRLGDDTTRPLAKQNGLAQLFEDRRPLYGRADFRVEVDTDDISQTVNKILGLPLF